MKRRDLFKAAAAAPLLPIAAKATHGSFTGRAVLGKMVEVPFPLGDPPAALPIERWAYRSDFKIEAYDDDGKFIREVLVPPQMKSFIGGQAVMLHSEPSVSDELEDYMGHDFVG